MLNLNLTDKITGQTREMSEIDPGVNDLLGEVDLSRVFEDEDDKNDEVVTG